MTDAIRDAYDRSAAAWRAGPVAVYARLAEALLGHAPVPLAGAVVLDAGAGTGVVGAAARRRGAVRAVGVDLAPAMLGGAVEAVAADLARLPFRDHAFDLAVAGLSLGHLPDPGPALAEVRRVVPVLLASAFAEGWTHPAKTVVEEVLAGCGYTAPAWYGRFKDGTERRVGDPGRLAALGRAAGFATVAVRRVVVATGVHRPGDLVAWRLGMAHHAPFVAGLPTEEQDAVRQEAERLLAGAPEVVVPMLVLTAR
ncbi:class I SAM-dependent methyltransferase [Nocardioides humi]|uniref:Methyltransferase type 11 domain-containing protein n=1 Tax=Nocardioides humi TaxID=449461 RepID=A0ABN2BIN9_9ACTN|nr:methyltransferase domain-containing protein [Nocardioides humi]